MVKTKEINKKSNKKVRLEQDRKVLVAMSGGVDSSVAAALLKETGFEVVGAFIKAWSLNKECNVRDSRDARMVANKLGIPFYVFDFEKIYKEKVVDYFVKTYEKGETPNPDVLCNKEIKFGVFLEKAKKIGINLIATGHYARLERESTKSKTRAQNKKFCARLSTQMCALVQNPKIHLLKGKDKNKDQSYFLWQLTQKELKHSLFPIGDYWKSEIRELAKKFGLPTAEKKDSQGICFLGQVEIKDFLEKYLKPKPGKIILPDGRIVGEHEGIVFYTIGQRHGFNLAISKTGLKTQEPLFVVGKRVKDNVLVVAPGRDNLLLYKKQIWLDKVNFVSGLKPESAIKVGSSIRYRQKPEKATLDFIIEKGLWLLNFKKPVWAPALGQSAVFYQKEELIGGGIIVGY